jgi:dienelactone hydrolase
MRSVSFCLAFILAGVPLSADEPAAPDAENPQIAAAKAFVDQLKAGEFAKAFESFDDTMRGAMPAESLEKVWKQVDGQIGPFRSVSGSRTEVKAPYTAVILSLSFEKGEIDARIVYDAKQKVAGLFFAPGGKYKPPKYVDPSKFTDVDVTVGKGLLTLPGSLSLPSGEGPFPCVVLVHGSGPNDRDETIGPNKPFRDIAHGLATRGIAVLRYEKRTKQHPLAMTLLGNGITVKQETVDDAVEAVATAAGQERIDPKRVFLAGHSLGGYLVPRIAAATDKAAGFISLAGSMRPMEDLILEQHQYLLSLEGEPTEELKAVLAKIEKQVALVKSPDLNAKTLASDLPLGIPAKYWLDLRTYDAVAEAKKITKPMLILQGQRDYQVTLADFALWKQAPNGKNDVKFVQYELLNHLFMAGPAGKSTPGEYMQPGNVAEEVVVDIAEWIGALGNQ